MKTIYKYPIQDTYSLAFAELPRYFTILKVAYQGDKLFIWCEVPYEPVDEDCRPDLVKAYFDVVATGDLISNKYTNRKFLDTVFHPEGFVFHVYRI